MTKEITKKMPAPASQTDVAPKAVIEDEHLRELLRIGHWTWATAGSRCGFRYGVDYQASHNDDLDFSTESNVFTVTSDSGANDLNVHPLVLNPHREQNGMTGATTWDDFGVSLGQKTRWLEISAYIQTAEVEVEIWAIDKDGVTALRDTKVLGNVSTWGWADLHVRVGVTVEEVLFFKVKARIHPGAQALDGRLRTLQIRSARFVGPDTYVNQDGKVLWAYGSEWTGLAENGDQLDSWNTDGLGEFEFAAPFMEPPISRPGDPDLNCDSAEFDPDAPFILETEEFSTWDAGPPEGKVFAVAYKRHNVGLSQMLMSKESDGLAQFYLYAQSSGNLTWYQRFIDPGSSSTYNYSVVYPVPGNPQNQWLDVLCWWDKSRSQMRMYFNCDGEYVQATATTTADITIRDEDPGPLFLGCYYQRGIPFDGNLALPYYATGVYTELEVQRLLAWRSRTLGIN